MVNVLGRQDWDNGGTFRLMQALIASNLTENRSEDEYFPNQSVDEGFNQHKDRGRFKTT